jgi:formylglycine-generating enzyme required for sulfatase activity
MDTDFAMSVKVFVLIIKLGVSLNIGSACRFFLESVWGMVGCWFCLFSGVLLMKKLMGLCLLMGMTGYAANPVVSNVSASQRTGTKLVDITYSVSDSDGDDVDVSLVVKNGSTPISASSLSGDIGNDLSTGNNKHIVWNAGADWDGNTATLTYTVTADDGTAAPTPSGMVRISGGTNSGTDPDFGSYSLTVSTIYMDATEVTKAQWDTVYNWAVANGYSFDNVGSGKGSSHPVHTVSWYDCVKWCNARSQKDGRTPCYTVGGSVYKAGQSSPDCNFSANGYRLPTSDEWEYAARGGLSGRRFPWGDTINHSYANYRANGSAYSYDTSSYTDWTFHPSYDDGGYPYTSPAGSFSANGYGLYDMSGNVWEWCDTASGSARDVRGGSWFNPAYSARCGNALWPDPGLAIHNRGLRAVCR